MNGPCGEKATFNSPLTMRPAKSAYRDRRLIHLQASRIAG
jgi:hypothetical protein